MCISTDEIQQQEQKAINLPYLPIEDALPPWTLHGYKDAYNKIPLKIDAYIHHPNPPNHTSQFKWPLIWAKHDSIYQHYFVRPDIETDKLISLLENSQGASILITGYRGSGKTSFVNNALKELRKRPHKDSFTPIEINLSTTRNSRTLCLSIIEELIRVNIQEKIYKTLWNKLLQSTHITLLMLLNLVQYYILIYDVVMYLDYPVDNVLFSRIYEYIKPYNFYSLLIITLLIVYPSFIIYFRRKISIELRNLLTRASAQIREERSIKGIIKYLPVISELTSSHIADYPMQDICQIQNGLKGICRKASKTKVKLVFVYDEVDKLTPLPTDATEQGEAQSKTSSAIQKEIFDLLSDMKSLLTESQAFHIFIAGKDFDDEWQKDRKSGEGLLESIFMQNIYLPSLLRRDLPKHHEFKDAQEAKNYCDNILESYKKKTGMSFSTFFRSSKYNKEKIFNFLMHMILSHAIGIRQDCWAYATGRLILPYFREEYLMKLFELGVVSCYEEEHKDTEVELTQRHISFLRSFLHYLTYKGKGMPRRIIEELYKFIQPDEDGGILSFSQAENWKVVFLGEMTWDIFRDQTTFRRVDDKGCVASFYILDYILKYHRTNFCWSDIENASFMVDKEIIFPSREFAHDFITLLEGKVIERVRPENKEYRILPRIRDKLGELYRQLGDEQLELRFTISDFAAEFDRLQKIDESLSGTIEEQRLEVVGVQARLSDIYSLTDRKQQAFQELGRACRLVNAHIQTLISKTKDKDFNTISLNRYVQLGVAILHKMGFLKEQESRLEEARIYYTEAIRLQQWLWKHCKLWTTHISIDPDEKKYYIDFIGDHPVTLTEDEQKILSRRIDSKKILKKFSSNLYNMNTVIKELYVDSKMYDLFQFSRCLTGKTEEYGLTQESLPEKFVASLNQHAICLEKLGHRKVSNRYIIAGYDFYLSRNDLLGLAWQSQFFGELLVRRRNMRHAAWWYWHAAIILSTRGNVCQNSEFSMSVRYRSLTYARVFDLLGDVAFATWGVVFLDKDIFKEGQNEKERKTEFHKITEKIKNECGRKGTIISIRDEEVFYTIAQHYYREAEKPLKVLDVYLKKVWIRYQRVFSSLSTYKDIKKKKIQGTEYLNSENDAHEYDFHYKQAWCLFWRGLENALKLCISENKMETKYPFEAILDRGRLGQIFKFAGDMLSDASSEDHLKNLIFVNDSDNDNYEDYSGGRIKNFKITIKEARSALIRVVNFLTQSMDSDNLLASFDGTKIKFPKINKYSPLYHLGKNNKKDEFPGIIRKIIDILSSQKKIPDTAWIDELHIKSLSEIMLLGANVALADNIDKMEAAKAYYSCGKLYTKTFAQLLNKQSEKKECQGEMYDIFVELYVAANRNLTAACKIFNREVSDIRHERDYAASAFSCSGDLYLMWHHVLDEYKQHKNRYKNILKKLHDSYSQEWQIRNCCSFTDIETVKDKCEHAYRNAIEQYYQQLSDYDSRYPLGDDSLYQRADFSDDKIHFGICRSVRNRHEDLKKYSSECNYRPISKLMTDITRELNPRTLEPDFKKNIYDLQKYILKIQESYPLAVVIRVENNSNAPNIIINASNTDKSVNENCSYIIRFNQSEKVKEVKDRIKEAFSIDKDNDTGQEDDLLAESSEIKSRRLMNKFFMSINNGTKQNSPETACCSRDCPLR